MRLVRLDEHQALRHIPIGESSLWRLEAGKKSPTPVKVLAILHALEAIGIEFDGDGHGASSPS